MYYIILYHISYIIYYILNIIYYILYIVYYIILYYIIYYIILYCIVLYYILYYIILILYYIILYFRSAILLAPSAVPCERQQLVAHIGIFHRQAQGDVLQIVIKLQVNDAHLHQDHFLKSWDEMMMTWWWNEDEISWNNCEFAVVVSWGPTNWGTMFRANWVSNPSIQPVGSKNFPWSKF